MKEIQVVKYVLIIILFTSTSCIYAQLIRSFPIDSKAGKLTAFNYPEVVISGQKMHLGAGGQIRDTNNHIILPTMMPDKTGSIRYQLDTMGNIHRIWFLTPEETSLAKEEERYKPK